MKLQIQLSSCTRFRHFSFNDKVTKQKNKTNPETRKNDQRHNQKKMNTSQIHYTLVQIDGCMYLVASIQFLNFDVNIYLIFTGDWNGIAYRCCDWRIRDLILAAGAPPPSPHVPGPVALVCQFPSVVIHGDRCLIIDYFVNLKRKPEKLLRNGLGLEANTS